MLELFAWGPGLDQPSFDPFCLSIEAYLNLTQVKWVVNECSSPYISPSGELPVLKIQFEPITGTASIIKVLKLRGHDLDQDLSPLQLAESQAFISLIEDKLYDALLYTWWIEQDNYVNSIQPTMGTHLSFFNKYMIPGQIRDRVRSRLGVVRYVKFGDDYVPEIYATAHECYKALADKLGEKSFFFGDTPTTLDAIAYGHLSLHAFPSLKVPALFTMLAFQFPTLIAFCERMRQHTFTTPLIRSPNERPTLRYLIGDFMTDPQSYLAWAWEGFQTQIVTDKTKEERVERFWKGATVVGAMVFFTAFIVKNRIVEVEMDLKAEE
ncbi:hypothetical protein BC833DRAFT_601453 [Globomyces pollinis-pini]|nr:hypothetical protein BC833DRAFT_601453 [Globomyces pollinis-pini]